MAACETSCCETPGVNGAAPLAKDKWYARDRLGGLRRFAAAITVFNLLGHFWFGFEQSWAQPLVGLAAAYGMELLVELVDVLMNRRRPRFLTGGVQNFVDFFLPAHISGLACSMLLYSNERLLPIAFAAAVAIASKAIFRVMTERGPRHVFNPSNFGITATLLLFPWVGISPPYHFTENLSGWADWFVPGVIIVSGSLLNTCFTRRLPLIITWLTVFVAQAVVRHLVFDASLSAALMPMSGVAFILFTFYMVTDPPTTPSSTLSQMAFAASVAIAYGVLMVLHVVFGLFFALSLVCAVRGLYMWVQSRKVVQHAVQAGARPATTTASRSTTISPEIAREPVASGGTGR
jgi:enediyne biosynthesis protein E5